MIEAKEATMRDCRGTVLEIGQKVAYNFSGSIAYGEIISLESKIKKTDARYYSSSFRVYKIKVKRILPVVSANSDISTITNPHNVMVINEI